MPNTFAMLRDDRELLSKALTAYKKELRADDAADLREYNAIEISAVDEFARRYPNLVESEYFTFQDGSRPGDDEAAHA